MTTFLKRILIAMFSVIACSFISFGFAAVTDQLTFSGEVAVAAPNFDEVVIAKVETLSSTLEYEDSYQVVPTNLKSTFTGISGQKVVYKITAHNYSETLSYVYAGVSYDSSIFPDINNVTFSASLDSNNTDVMGSDVSSTYYVGTAITPESDFIFYVTYTLTDNLSVGEILINYVFKPIIYTVTYLNNNENFAVEHVTDNSVAHNVITDKPVNSNLVFCGWVNANAIVVTTIPAGNTNSYMLSASWENVYLIIFADANGEVLYEEQFTDSSTKLSAEGQARVDQILADLNVMASQQDMKVTWSDYDISSATSDITVKAIYSYDGLLNLVPVYEEPDDGIVDYYKILAVDSLPNTVEVPGEVNGVPVKVVERITNVDGDKDWDNFEENVKSIIIGEGVERLEHNSLAWTPNLSTVKLPNTLKFMGKNTFSRNIALGGFGRGDDKKVLTIDYNGTKAEWKQVLANSNADWDGGLKKGSIVRCSDGYFELEGTFSLSWKEKSY